MITSNTPAYQNLSNVYNAMQLADSASFDAAEAVYYEAFQAWQDDCAYRICSKNNDTPDLLWMKYVPK